MTTESQTIETLGKIERHFAGTSIAGKPDPDKAARESILNALREAEAREGSVELHLSLSDPMTMKLFLAVCQRYGLRPYQRSGQHRTTVMLKIPPSFSRDILVPEFQQLSEALAFFLRDTMERLIENSVFRGNSEAVEKAAMTG